MKRYIYIIALCTGLAITHAKAEENILPSCAVIDFEHTAEASAADADSLANLISVEITRTATYRVVPRHKVSQALRSIRFEPKAYKNQASAALGASKILGVDYVVFGTISRQGSKNEASAFMLKRDGARLTRGTRATSAGSTSVFTSSSAGEMARQLTGSPAEQPKLPATPPSRVAAPSKTAEAPVSHRLAQTSTTLSGQVQHYFRKFQSASQGRLETGIRYRKQSLDKETGDFLGTINTLDVENDGIPAELFAAWYFHENFGAEISWFNLRAKTITNPEGFSDGAICVSGPTFAVTGRLTQFRPWTPFASLGLGLFSAEFDHAAWWARGYESEVIWLELGSPDAVIKSRRMNLEDTTGKFLLLGVNYAADEHWSFEIAYRIMTLDVDDHYTITESEEVVIDRGTTPFPLDNTSFMVGARYSF